MTTPEPLVSVIVPVYDAGALLTPCLESLDAQRYPALEVIVVDDGSTDGSLGVARSFAERRPERFSVLAATHSGRAVARQRGVDAARGAFVGFVDADDIADPGLYETLVAACMAGPGADLAVCRYRNLAPDGTPGHVYEEGTPELFGGALVDHPELLVEVEASLCNKLFARSLFDLVAFPPGRDFEDLATTYRLLGRASRIVRADGPPLYSYRQGGPVSVMAAYDMRYLDVAEAVRITCGHFRAEGTFGRLEPQLLRLALRHLVFSRFGSLFDRGDRAVVWPYLDAAYAVLDEQFGGWRHSHVLRAMCGSARSHALVRSKALMKLFTLVRSRVA